MPGWHARAVEDGRRAGIAQTTFLTRPRKPRKAEPAPETVPVEPACPRLDQAEAARLVRTLTVVVEDGMLEHLEGTRARSLVAELASHDGGGEGTAPRGDGDLSPAELALRSTRQMTIVQERLGVSDRWAARILASLKPTGEPTLCEAQRLGHDLPDAASLGLPATDEDRTWLAAATERAMAFDDAARQILALVPMASFDASPWNELGGVAASVERARSHGFGPGSGWTFEPTRAALDEAARLEAVALAAVRDLWAAVAARGAAPFLMPLRQVSLSLGRTSEWSQAWSGHRWGPPDPEAWLEIGHEVHAYQHGPDLDWEAGRALGLLSGLRRVFLQAGWSGGDVWMVAAKEGTGSVAAHPVLARSAGEAVAWWCAARSAMRAVQQHDGCATIRIHGVEGPDGPADVEAAVRDALGHPVAAWPWVRRRRVGVPAKPRGLRVSWEVMARADRRAVLIRSPERWAGESRIVVIDDSLGGMMQAIATPFFDEHGQPSWMGDRPAGTEMLREMAATALAGGDPWAPGGIAARACGLISRRRGPDGIGSRAPQKPRARERTSAKACAGAMGIPHGRKVSRSQRHGSAMASRHPTRDQTPTRATDGRDGRRTTPLSSTLILASG